LGNRSLVQQSAGRAWTENVATLEVYRFIGDDAGTECLGRLEPRGVDVRYGCLRSGIDQQANEREADLADPLHDDTLAVDPRLEAGSLDGGAQAAEDALGGHRRRIAAATERFGDTDAEAAGLPQALDVDGVGAEILRGDVAAAERIDEASQRAKQLRPARRRRHADDHGFAAAEIEAGERRFQAHRLRK